MTSSIVNAAPMTIMQGTQDKSAKQLVAVAEALPTHLPKIYFYAKEGPTDPQLVSGASRTMLYGADSFDMRLKWATHTTILSNIINGKANAQMAQRLVPADAAPPAKLRLMLDVLPVALPVYQRNADGSIKLDVNNNPLAASPATTVQGFKCKWVSAVVGLQVDDFGIATQANGDLTDSSTQVQSTRYPILDLEVSNFGAYGNNVGLRMWAPTTNQSGIVLDERLVADQKVYPFRMACIRRDTENSTPGIVTTLATEQYVDVCFKPNTIDLNTDKLLYVGDTFIAAYENKTDPLYPPVFGPFGKMHMYDANVTSLLNMFYAAEVAVPSDFTDFTGDLDEEYRVNLISATTSGGVPYNAVRMVTDGADGVRLTQTTNLYARGGSDGTMSNALLDGLVADQLAGYIDDNSSLQDSALNPESIMYDSGFSLATKKAMAQFIGLRKDTSVVLACHTVGNTPLTASEESSLALVLRSRVQNYPESDEFGTPAMRAMIVGRSGKMTGVQFNGHLPLALEIASKAADYMGASNGVWKSAYNFDSAPASTVSLFTDVNVTTTPAAVRNKDWAAGLNWVEQFDRRQLYFPALKTVFENDTSVLTSFFTMQAIVELEKVGERARRQFSGVTTLTNAQLIERLNEFVIANTVGRFDGRFVIRSNAHITVADLARGYSWTLAIQIYAPNMKTVGTLSIESYRIEDLPS
jgi:hypothetical protein